MNSAQVAAALDGLDIGPVRTFDQIDSTNAEAARWVEQGCPDLALVVADEQTAGRGRAGRRWFTPPGAALAFSLVLLPEPSIAEPGLLRALPRLTALGALAVCETLRSGYNLLAEIKWPNDVLCSGQKCCGVLAEAIWQGNELAAIILGIGINVKPAAVPPVENLAFPATCIETALEAATGEYRTIERLDLLRSTLNELLQWRSQIANQVFLQAWEACLAFRNQWVRASLGTTGASEIPTTVVEGELLGLEPDGQLRLRDGSGQIITLRSGELNLRPVRS